MSKLHLTLTLDYVVNFWRRLTYNDFYS